jgi:hypothetical protein
LAEIGGDLGDVGGVDVVFLGGKLNPLAANECGSGFQLAQGGSVLEALGGELGEGGAQAGVGTGDGGVVAGLDSGDELLESLEDVARGIQEKLIAGDIDGDGLIVLDFDGGSGSVAVVIDAPRRSGIEREGLGFNFGAGEEECAAGGGVADADELLLNAKELVGNGGTVAI